MIVNGKKEGLEQPLNLLNFLKKKQLVPERIVVEYNGEILPREKWEETVLKQDDVLEIISFVGGG